MDCDLCSYRCVSRIHFAIIIDVINSNDSASSIDNRLRIKFWLLGGDANYKNWQDAFTDFASKSLASFLVVACPSFPGRT